MTSQEASIAERLCKAKDPRNFYDWEKQDGYYIAACRASIGDVPHLIDIARKWSDPDWPSSLDGFDVDLDDDVGLLPVTAWRTLADLKSDTAVQPLIDMLCELDDEFDDWASEELPHVFGKIGEPAIETLVQVANDADKQGFVRSIAARGLRCVVEYHAETRNQIVAWLTKMMVNAAKDNIEFNTTLLVELVELQAVEAAEPIERAFADDLLDTGMMGNWENVRQELEVEGLGLEMPEIPYNSIRQLQSQMKIETSSDQPIFGIDKFNHDTEPEPATAIARGKRVGRNDLCPCGSGKKYKKCCRQ